MPVDTRKGRKSDSSSGDSSVRSAVDATKTELLNELHKIHNALNALQTKMSDVEGSLLKVLETQKRQDMEIKYLKEDVIKIKESHDNILAEIENRDRRKPNLIISGIQEKEDGSADERKRWDLSRVKALFSALGSFTDDIISNMHRIGRVNSSKPRLLKIVCKDTDSKRSLLFKAKNLRKVHEFKNIYINPDLTPVQQAQNRQLREELSLRRNLGEEVMIQHGKIVQMSSKQNFR